MRDSEVTGMEEWSMEGKRRECKERVEGKETMFQRAQ